MLSRKMHSLLFLSFIYLGLVACDNSDPVNDLPEPPKDIVAPTTAGSFPSNDDGQTFKPDVIVNIEFSELMDEGSLLSGGILLFTEDAGINPDSEPVLNKRNHSLSFNQFPGVGLDPVTGDAIDIEVTAVNLQPPKKRFALGTTYNVQAVLDSALDLAGNPMNSEGGAFEFSFSIEDGIWQPSELVGVSIPDPSDVLLETELLGDVFNPQIASNSKGDILAVWQQAIVQGGALHILGSRYMSDSKTWGVADLQSSAIASADIIDADLVDDAFGPKVAVNKNGLAAVVWHQKPLPGAETSVWINIFDGTSWLGASDILESSPSSAEEANSPIVVIDDDGNILVAWREFDSSSGFFRIKSGLYDKTVDVNTGKPNGLGNVVTFADILVGAENGNDLQLDITSQGFALLVWSQEVSGVTQIYANRYLNNTWGADVRIDGDQGGGAASAPSLAIDENDNAFVIWQQFDGVRENIWFNRYAGGVWGTVTTDNRLETDNRGDAVNPMVTFSRDNQAFVIWQQDLGSGKVLNVRLFENDDWAPSEVVASVTGVNQFSKPMIKFDREGNAMAAWVSGNGAVGAVGVNRYSEAAKSWLGAEAMSDFSSNSQGLVLEPLLEDGRMLALWYHSDGTIFSLASALFSE